MKRCLAFAGILCAATSAYALQHPQPAIPLEKGGDPHVQVARFDPFQPVLVVGALGRPVTITFKPGEEIIRVNLDQGYVADGKTVPRPWNGPDPEQLGKQPLANTLPLWPVITGRSSADVTTRADDGTTRVYQFVLVALPPQPDDCATTETGQIADCDDPRITAGLSFTYPPEKPKAEPAAIQQVRARWMAQKAAEKLAAEARLKQDIFYGPRNWRYVAKGTPEAIKHLGPDQISDNTQVTGLLYLGNREIPSLYIVDAGGVERQVTASPDKDLMVVGETARHWRLRKGTEVVDLWNQGYDAIGVNPETGTISPNVLRITREVPPK